MKEEDKAWREGCQAAIGQPQSDDSRGPACFVLPEPAAGGEGKPIKVLSTSLGIALFASAFLGTGAVTAETSGGAGSDEPKLVSWSTDEVKAYFDKNADWSLPLDEKDETENGGATSGESGGTGGTTVINNYGGYGYHSGFGWDDVLLYHMLFNSGARYSSAIYYQDRRAYYAGTNRAYQPKSYASSAFQNKPVAGSVVKPKTSASSGTFKSRGTSSTKGSIGGKSSGLSSSGSSKSGGSKSGISGSRSSGFGGFGG